MNTDFRLSTGLFTHPKFVKLRRKLGAEGALSYITFLSFVAQNNPDGDLGSMDSEDIAIAGQYDGDAGEFVAALVAVRFLDAPQEDGDSYTVHDWAEHNPWAASAPARSSKAKAAAAARWGNASNTNQDDKHCSEDATSIATSIVEQCPSPNPNPYPSPLPETVYESQDIDQHLPPDEQEAGVLPLNPSIQSESEPKVSTKALTVKRESKWMWLQNIRADWLELADVFESEFYCNYPRKEAPQSAFRAFVKLKPEWSDDFKSKVFRGLAKYCASPQWRDPTKIPFPATWLNDRRWEGDPADEGPPHVPKQRQFNNQPATVNGANTPWKRPT